MSSPADSPDEASRPRTPRARARAEAIDRIKALAWEQLAQSGAAALSLRAIAREMGLVSSALYRYFPSREALLTALIVDAYHDLGSRLSTAAQVEHAAIGRSDHSSSGPARQQWHRVCHALRRWALDEPHRFALIYGTPVPGYVAPQETIEPAAGVMSQFLQVAAAAPVPTPATSTSGPTPAPGPASTQLTEQLNRLGNGLNFDIAPARALAGVEAIGLLFGVLTLELGGHLVGTFEPADALYAHTVARGADLMGL